MLSFRCIDSARDQCIIALALASWYTAAVKTIDADAINKILPVGLAKRPSGDFTLECAGDLLHKTRSRLGGSLHLHHHARSSLLQIG